MSRNIVDLRPRFRVRILALLLDYALILGWVATTVVVTLVISSFTGGLFDWLVLGTGGAQLLGFLVLTLPVGVYLCVCEASARQATLGKRVLGLQVVSATDAGRPSLPHVVVRTVVKLLPWEIAHFAMWNIIAVTSKGSSEFPLWLTIAALLANVLPVGYVACVAFQADRRGPHDLVAGTQVVVSAKTKA